MRLDGFEVIKRELSEVDGFIRLGFKSGMQGEVPCDYFYCRLYFFYGNVRIIN